MLVGSLTAQESQAAFYRGTSPEAGGRPGAGSAAHMTAVRGWRGRCLAQGNSPQAGGRLWLQQKIGKRLKRNSCRYVGGTRGSEGDGDGFLFTGQGLRAWNCDADLERFTSDRMMMILNKLGARVEVSVRVKARKRERFTPDCNCVIRHDYSFLARVRGWLPLIR